MKKLLDKLEQFGARFTKDLAKIKNSVLGLKKEKDEVVIPLDNKREDNPLKESLEEFNKTVEEYNKFLRDTNRKIENKIDESIKLMERRDEIKG